MVLKLRLQLSHFLDWGKHQDTQIPWRAKRKLKILLIWAWGTFDWVCCCCCYLYFLFHLNCHNSDCYCDEVTVEMPPSPRAGTEAFTQLLQGWIPGLSSSGTALRTSTQKNLDWTLGGFIMSQKTNEEKVVPQCSADPQITATSSPFDSLCRECEHEPWFLGSARASQTSQIHVTYYECTINAKNGVSGLQLQWEMSLATNPYQRNPKLCV